MRTPAVRDPAVVLNPGTAGVGIIHALGIAGVPIITVGRRWPPLLGVVPRWDRLLALGGWLGVALGDVVPRRLGILAASLVKVPQVSRLTITCQ